jgi:hypothetical protein
MRQLLPLLNERGSGLFHVSFQSPRKKDLSGSASKHPHHLEQAHPNRCMESNLRPIEILNLDL